MIISATPHADFGELAHRVRAAGLTERTSGYYAVCIVVNLFLMTTGFLVLTLGPSSWWQLVTAVFLAVTYTRIGLAGHDVAHGQVTRRRGWTEALGRLHGNLLLGFSYGWWVGHHNRHHSHPNHTELDPDILRRLVVFTPEQGNRRHGLLRRLIRYQGWLYGPLMLLDSVGLRLASIRALRHREVRRPGVEGGLMVLHLVGYLTMLAVSLTPAQASVFLVVHQGLFGFFLGSLFAPNHKGMPVRSGADELPWLHRQVLTARNVRGGRLVDLWYGGLNYQIEHHLFPAMPRRHLKAAARIVQSYCADCGIPYHEVGVRDSYKEISRYLTVVSNAVFPRSAER